MTTHVVHSRRHDDDLPERRRKDVLTIVHQIATLILFPVVISALLWFAATFDTLRFDVAAIKIEVASHSKSLDQLTATARR